MPVISAVRKRALEAGLYPHLEQHVFGRVERALRQRLPRGAVVLDAGSGPGSWLLGPLRDTLGLWVGADIYRPDQRQVDAFVQAPCEALPFADGSFDAIVAYLVVEHLPEPQRAFAEFARVLRPGGYFCFKTPAVYTPLFLLAKLLPTRWHKAMKSRIGTEEEDIFPTYYRANRVTLLERQLTGVGFRRDWLTTVDQTYAYLSHTPFTYALGLLYSRATELPFLAWLRNQIVGIYRLPEEKE